MVPRPSGPVPLQGLLPGGPMVPRPSGPVALQGLLPGGLMVPRPSGPAAPQGLLPGELINGAAAVEAGGTRLIGDNRSFPHMRVFIQFVDGGDGVVVDMLHIDAGRGDEIVLQAALGGVLCALTARGPVPIAGRMKAAGVQISHAGVHKAVATADRLSD